MRRKYSYQWAAERVKNVLGLALATIKEEVPKQDPDLKPHESFRPDAAFTPDVMQALLNAP